MSGLEQFPARMDRLESQILQFRDEVRGEFSAVRDEIRAGDNETRRTIRDEIRAGDEETRRTLREEIRAGDEETRRTISEEIRAGDDETRRTIREEIRAGDDETRRVLRAEIQESVVMVVTTLTEHIEATREALTTQIEDARRYTRVLHEEALGRIAVLGEGLGALSDRVDALDTSLSQKIDRTDAKVDLILARLGDGPGKAPGRRK